MCDGQGAPLLRAIAAGVFCFGEAEGTQARPVFHRQLWESSSSVMSNPHRNLAPPGGFIGRRSWVGSISRVEVRRAGAPKGALPDHRPPPCGCAGEKKGQPSGLPLSAYFVEEVGWYRRGPGFPGSGFMGGWGYPAFSGGGWCWHRDELRHLPEVLGGGGQVELVTGPVGPS